MHVKVQPASALTAEIRNYLGVALEGRGMALAASETGAVAIVDIELMLVQDRLESARIVVHDDLYDKRVERVLALAGLPLDGVPLAVAASADELLRASWAEMTLSDAPAAQAPVPQQVAHALSDGADAREPSIELGVDVGGLVFADWTSIDVGLRATWHWGERAHVAARFAYALAATRRSARGEVTATAPLIELAGGMELLPAHSPVGLSIELPLIGALPRFEARPNPAGQGTSFSEWALIGGLRARLHAGAGPLRTWLSVGGLFGLRGAEARDEGQRVLALRRLGGQCSAGIAYFF